MSGAWVPDPADLATDLADPTASPTAEALPLPDSKKALKQIAKRERERQKRGIGFAAGVDFAQDESGPADA